MNNRNTDSLDMIAELFIPLRTKMEYLIPPKSEEEYLLDLEQGTDLAKKTEALHALIYLYRLKTMDTGNKYTENAAGGIATIFKRFASGPDLASKAAYELAAEGGNCEQVGDYQGAAWFYASSLEFKTHNSELSFFKVNNLGFALNCLKRFEAAEVYLRLATEIDPQRYNAWKNLGVSLEHQGKSAEAADCYIKAITRSHGEGRSVKHLLRLTDRHPEVKDIPEVKRFLLNFPKGKA